VTKFAVAVSAAAAVVAAALPAYHDRLIDGAHAATRWVLLAAGVWFLACQLWVYGVRRRDPAGAFAEITLVGSAGILVALAVQEYVPDAWLRAWTGASDGPALMLAGVGAVWCAVAVTGTLGDASRNRPRPCPTCREPIRPGALKCRHCQTLLPGERTVPCPRCAETVLADATGCRHCGYADAGGARLSAVPRPGVQVKVPPPERAAMRASRWLAAVPDESRSA
jgi:hypothetical protein